MSPDLHYCDNCRDLVPVSRDARQEIYPVRGEDVEIRATVAVCRNCGTVVYDEVLDESNLQRAYESYRRRKGILSPGEIRRIREQSGLSRRALARLLGVAEATIRRYETGAAADCAHSAMIKRLAGGEGTCGPEHRQPSS